MCEGSSGRRGPSYRSDDDTGKTARANEGQRRAEQRSIEVRTGGNGGQNGWQRRSERVAERGATEDKRRWTNGWTTCAFQRRTLSICAHDRPANHPSRRVAEYGKQRRKVSVRGRQTKVAPFDATDRERRCSGSTPRPRQGFTSADRPWSAMVRNRASGSAAAPPLACPSGRAHVARHALRRCRTPATRAVSELREVGVHVSRPDARVRRDTRGRRTCLSLPAARAWRPNCTRPADVALGRLRALWP